MYICIYIDIYIYICIYDVCMCIYTSYIYIYIYTQGTYFYKVSFPQGLISISLDSAAGFCLISWFGADCRGVRRKPGHGATSEACVSPGFIKIRCNRTHFRQFFRTSFFWRFVWPWVFGYLFDKKVSLLLFT